MNAKQLLEQGRLAEAIDELNSELRTRPADTKLRIFLFELLCFAGRHERAAKQLKILATQSDMQGAVVAQVYGGLLEAEQKRRAVFAGDGLPKFLLSPPDSVQHCLLLLAKMRESGQPVGPLLEQAEEAFPALAGKVGEAPFAAFRDGDDRLAPVLEAFRGDEYLWIPFQQIQEMEVTPPKTLLDLYWIHVRIQAAGANTEDVFVPVLYVDSEHSGDPTVQLGRTTEWEIVQDRMLVGKGLRLLVIDDREVPLPELGRVSFETPLPQEATL